MPAGLRNVVAIAAGDDHSLALKADGTVVAWGNSEFGDTTVPPGLTNVVAITGYASGTHHLALRGDGTVVAWGNNQFGETTIPPGLTNVVAVAVGAYHSLALVGGVPPSPPGGILFVTVNSSSQLACIGATVTLQAMVVGFPPLSYHYQWRFNGINLAGATNSTLVLAGVQTADAGNYSVVVGDAVGTMTSRSASLTVVDSPPVILAQPGDQTVYCGALAVLQVLADGSWPLSYQWQFNGTNLKGATNAFIELADVQFDDSGIYFVVVSNALGRITSRSASLTVVGYPPVISVQPAYQEILMGNSATFQVVAIGLRRCPINGGGKA